mmetsp:Transcript_19712/g.48198  ORF Transcript_19712/g.48198 Transcript_19712/m.48198 type:complete len:151 (-) Transcript_19712:119-571(-)
MISSNACLCHMSPHRSQCRHPESNQSHGSTADALQGRGSLTVILPVLSMKRIGSWVSTKATRMLLQLLMIIMMTSRVRIGMMVVRRKAATGAILEFRSGSGPKVCVHGGHDDRGREDEGAHDARCCCSGRHLSLRVVWYEVRWWRSFDGR